MLYVSRLSFYHLPINCSVHYLTKSVIICVRYCALDMRGRGAAPVLLQLEKLNIIEGKSVLSSQEVVLV